MKVDHEGMIVKVQASLVTTAKIQRVLAYNEDRSICFDGPLKPEVRKLLRGRLKAYFYARVRNGELDLEEEAEEQSW